MGPKRKRTTLSIAQKLDILKKLDSGFSSKSIQHEYDIGASTVSDIKHAKDKIRNFFQNTTGSYETTGVFSRKAIAKPKLPLLDDALYEWFLQQRSKGVSITGPMLPEKARSFHQMMNITDTCAFSQGWLQGFKTRHGIRKLDIVGESESADKNAAHNYCDVFEDLVKRHNLSPNQIYNADETGLLWRCQPKTTLAGFEEKTVKGFKSSKERLTILNCANLSGTHRLKLFVIGKSKSPRALKNIKNLPVIYRSQKNSWMDLDLFQDWFNNHFVLEVHANFRKEGLPEDSKVLLLLDNCRAHPPSSELRKGNVFTMFLPPNVTSLIQPMNQGIIQNFIANYKSNF